MNREMETQKFDGKKHNRRPPEGLSSTEEMEQMFKGSAPENKGGLSNLVVGREGWVGGGVVTLSQSHSDLVVLPSVFQEGIFQTCRA